MISLLIFIQNTQCGVFTVARPVHDTFFIMSFRGFLFAFSFIGIIFMGITNIPSNKFLQRIFFTSMGIFLLSLHVLGYLGAKIGQSLDIIAVFIAIIAGVLVFIGSHEDLLIIICGAYLAGFILLITFFSGSNLTFVLLIFLALVCFFILNKIHRETSYEITKVLMTGLCAVCFVNLFGLTFFNRYLNMNKPIITWAAILLIWYGVGALTLLFGRLTRGSEKGEIENKEEPKKEVENV